jgi:hypothetical protein
MEQTTQKLLLPTKTKIAAWWRKKAIEKISGKSLSNLLTFYAIV